MTETVSLKVVQAQADALGIPYHHRAGAEKIAGMVAAHLAANPYDALKLAPEAEDEKVFADIQTEPDTSADIVKVPTKAAGDPCPVTPMTADEFHQTSAAEAAKGIGALRRVQIQCMNPMKREWPGEIISVGSAKYGTYKKYIPFDGQPYHVPQIIYDVLKERQCTLFRTEKDTRGNDHRVGYLSREFNIVDLPPLSKKELAELREKQQLAKAGL